MRETGSSHPVFEYSKYMLTFKLVIFSNPYLFALTCLSEMSKAQVEDGKQFEFHIEGPYFYIF